MTDSQEYPEAQATIFATIADGSTLSEGFRARYKMGDILGQGAMGIVYRATEIATGLEVAIKFTLADGPGLLARFTREARILSYFDHPNLMKVMASGEEQGMPYIVCELLVGESLRALVNRQGQFLILEAMRIFKDLLLGLSVAHEHKVLHRDIKSENVMILKNGVVKLCDFGLARDEYDQDRLTKTGMIMGTPEYMAPELTRGGEATVASDLYACGCVLHELVTGRVPYPSTKEDGTQSTLFEILGAHISSPVPSMRDKVPGCPAFLDAVLADLMDKNPDDRPASAKEVLADIERFEHILVAESANPTMDDVPVPAAARRGTAAARRVEATPAAPPAPAPVKRGPVSGERVPVVPAAPAPPAAPSGFATARPSGSMAAMRDHGTGASSATVPGVSTPAGSPTVAGSPAGGVVGPSPARSRTTRRTASLALAAATASGAPAPANTPSRKPLVAGVIVALIGIAAGAGISTRGGWGLPRVAGPPEIHEVRDGAILLAFGRETSGELRAAGSRAHYSGEARQLRVITGGERPLVEVPFEHLEKIEVVELDARIGGAEVHEKFDVTKIISRDGGILPRFQKLHRAVYGEETLQSGAVDGMFWEVTLSHLTATYTSELGPRVTELNENLERLAPVFEKKPKRDPGAKATPTPTPTPTPDPALTKRLAATLEALVLAVRRDVGPWGPMAARLLDAPDVDLKNKQVVYEALVPLRLLDRLARAAGCEVQTGADDWLGRVFGIGPGLLASARRDTCETAVWNFDAPQFLTPYRSLVDIQEGETASFNKHTDEYGTAITHLEFEWGVHWRKEQLGPLPGPTRATKAARAKFSKSAETPVLTPGRKKWDPADAYRLEILARDQTGSLTNSIGPCDLVWVDTPAGWRLLLHGGADRFLDSRWPTLTHGLSGALLHGDQPLEYPWITIRREYFEFPGGPPHNDFLKIAYVYLRAPR